MTSPDYLGIIVPEFPIRGTEEMIRISEAASLALHAMVIMAEDENRRYSTKDLTDRLGVSEAHLAKFFKDFRKAALVKSTRGPQGGFVLLKPAKAISLLTIYECIDGPFEGAICVLEKGNCNHGKCIFGKYFPRSASRFGNICPKPR